MSEKKNSGLGLRSFVSVLLTFSFAVLVFTGIILFITPPGRIAHWTGWKILGLGKEQWGAVHICFSICVIIASILHIYLNFRPLLSYFKDRLTKKFAFRLDWFAALILCIAVFAGAVAAIPPFSSIMNINDRIKFSWEKPAEKAPIPHAETMTLADLAKKADLDLDLLLENLEKAEIIPAKPETVINQLARKYKMTPMQIYKIAIGELSGKPGRTFSPAGTRNGQKRRIGKKTLKQFCEEENIDIIAAIEKLKQAGINADGNDNMRALADRAMTNPGEIAKIAASSKK